MATDIVTEVLVVGAGVVGASCAYHVAATGRDVTVVDMFSSAAEGSTGRSFASIRAQWADWLNTELSWRSIQQFRDFRDTHGIDIGYRPSGYLFLVPDALWEAHLQAVDLQHEHGVPVDVLDVAAAQKITPFDPTGIAGGTWGRADGVVDPYLATNAYLDLARGHGAKTLFRHKITVIEADETTGGWTVTAGEARIKAQQVINAAGGWAGEIAALAGLSVPVIHSRRNIYATAPGALGHELPMTIDLTTGVYLRTEGQRLLYAAARPDQTPGYETRVDWEWMETVLQRAVSRFPWLADLPLDSAASWAGSYENTPDHQGILGADPAAPTWINACGFSGHGLMQAPEIGRLTAEQVSTGTISSIDVSGLRIERFAGAGTTTDLVELVI